MEAPPDLRRASMGTALSLRPTGFSTAVHNQLLKEDDDLLRQTFLSIFRHHHPDLANKVDVIFALAQVGPVGVGAQGLCEGAASSGLRP